MFIVLWPSVILYSRIIEMLISILIQLIHSYLFDCWKVMMSWKLFFHIYCYSLIILAGHCFAHSCLILTFQQRTNEAKVLWSIKEKIKSKSNWYVYHVWSVYFVNDHVICIYLWTTAMYSDMMYVRGLFWWCNRTVK